MTGVHDPQEYKRALRREARFWARGDPLSELWFARGATDPITRYASRLVTGDAGKLWFRLIEGSGPFRRACSLGSGMSLVERELARLGVVDTWDLYDLSPRVLRRAKRSMGRHRRRVTTHAADINRVSLRRNAYDLVLCFTSLHHFVELERILDEIAGALTQNGLLLVWDFVGENRMQWSAARIAFQQALLDDVPAEFWVSPDARIKPTDTLTMSPFEAVRSADIPALLQERFRPESWITFCGALVPLLLYLRTEDLDRARPDILERLFEVDLELSRNPSPDFVNPQLCALLRGL